MLRRISISNYLLIDSLELDLGKGLTIITGETGSGKSILIGALALAMGERAEAGVQREADKRCIIELEVDTKGLGLAEWFTGAGIPEERYTILRRQLDPGGRSRAFVNDTPVKLEHLRELGERLVHVHSQHHTLLLNDPGFQLGLVDHVADQRAQVDSYEAKYREWRSLQRELVDLEQREANAQGELDYARFQLNELDEARLKPDEQPGLERELARVENAEDLIQALRAVEEVVNDDGGLLALINRARQAVTKPARLDTSINTLLTRLNSIHIELKDIADEAERTTAGISIDPAKADQLRERLDLLSRLQQKHRVADTEQLITLREAIRERMGSIDDLSERLVQLRAEELVVGQRVSEAAKELSRVRMTTIEPLANKVGIVLKDLGMPHAEFQFEHRTVEPGPQGIDTIRALFSANKDRAPAALDKVASGGELSRVMLALISLAADSQDLPTVIFDEIDTGVSGEVADRVGTLLARMGRDRQVVAITHLAQIASKGSTHLLVSKSEHDDRVSTMIRPLDPEERVEALAHMLSGRKLTKAALDNARALIGNKV